MSYFIIIIIINYYYYYYYYYNFGISLINSIVYMLILHNDLLVL